MKKLIFSLGVIGLLASCSAEKVIEVPITHVEATSNVSKTVADISIDGMTCEMGCVATVKSKLNGLKGIEGIEIDFDADRQIDFAHVEFDESIVSEKEMIETIQAIGDGLYSVTAVEVIDYKQKESQENETDGESVSYKFEIPNILQVVDVLMKKL